MFTTYATVATVGNVTIPQCIPEHRLGLEPTREKFAGSSHLEVVYGSNRGKLELAEAEPTELDRRLEP